MCETYGPNAGQSQFSIHIVHGNVDSGLGRDPLPAATAMVLITVPTWDQTLGLDNVP